MNNIVVVGSINADLVFTTDIRPNAGETVTGKDFKIVPGGKGANQAIAASKLGANVTMLGFVGRDVNGDLMIDNLQKQRVDCSHIELCYKPTGVANIVISGNDNSIIVIPGANYSLTKEYIDKCRDIILGADIVLLQLEVPYDVVKYTLDLCYQNNIKTILNPAPAIKLDDDVIKKSTYITPNEHECKLILGIDKNVDIVDVIKEFPNKMLITLGDKGVMYYDGEQIQTVDAYKVEVVDTTGAGDTFNGAFARAIVNNMPIKEAISFANKASSISVTRFGAQGGMPTLEQIEK